MHSVKNAQATTFKAKAPNFSHQGQDQAFQNLDYICG